MNVAGLALVILLVKFLVRRKNLICLILGIDEMNIFEEETTYYISVEERSIKKYQF